MVSLHASLSSTPPTRGRILIWGSLTALAPLSIDMYLPAFPVIGHDFGVNSGQMAYSLTAYFLGMSFGQLLHGPLSDRYGRVTMLRNGLALYVIASLLCALSPHFAWFLGARFLQALGGCAALVIVRAMVRDQCDASTSAKIFSRMILVMGVAPMLAPSLGAVVTDVFNWQAIFIVQAAYAAIMMWLVERRFVVDRPSLSTLDTRAVFSAYSALLRDHHFMRYLFCSAFCSAALFAYISAAPSVFIEHYHLSATHFSWLFGINAAAFVFSAQVNASLLTRFPAPFLLSRFQLLSVIVAVLLLGFALVDTAFYWYGLPITVLLGCLGLTQPNAVALAMATQSKNIGSASALIGCVQFLLAMLASNSVATFHRDDGVTLAAVVLACALAASVALFWRQPSS